MAFTHRPHRRCFVAGSLAVLAACSPERPPLEPAVGVSPMPAGRSLGKSDRLSAELVHLDETVDGWTTESLARAAAQPLDSIAALVRDRFQSAPPGATADFSCTAFRPSELQPVYSNGGLEVARGNVGAERRAGPAGLVESLRELAAVHDGEADIHASFEIVRVDTTDDVHFATTVRVQLWSSGKPASVQQNADWTVRWEWNDRKGAPLLQSIDAARYEEVRAPRALFSDCTEAVLGANTAWKEQFLRGTDDWCARIDVAAGMNQYAHNGLAIGDVDEDGLDDLYVCQSGGLPNRLFKHRADGTAVDVSQAAGVDWLNDSAAALFVDLDNDGHQDLAITTDRFLLVMRGDGAGKFELKYELPFQGGYSLAAADYDGDRLLDLYVCRYNTSETSIGLPSPYHDATNGPANALLRNKGAFEFVEVTKDVGLDVNNRRFSFAASFVDYDEDGDLDIYVSNDFGRKNLYRNDGGKFKDVARESGVDDVSAGMGASWGDYDGDGDLDLYGSNMYTAAGQRISHQERFRAATPPLIRAEYQRHARGNALFRNDTGGKFEDVTLASGTALGRWAWCAQFCDVNNDGRADLFVPNGFVTNDDTTDLGSYFWRRVVAQSPTTGTLTVPYADAWNVVNRLIREGLSWAGNEPNTTYLNLGDGTFADISFPAGLAFTDDARCFAMVDWDHDGDQDFWIANRTAPRVRFARNDTEGTNRWVAFRLTGTKCNRDAIGARIDATAGGRRFVRILQAGSGYLSQSSNWMSFGVGDVERLDDVLVRWPDGSTSRFTDVATNARYRLTQGDASLSPAPPVGAAEAAKLVSSSPVPAESSEIARIALNARPAAPPLTFTDYDGTKQRLGADKRPTLVAFWSSACPSCVNQLDAWSRAKDELTAAGISIFALSLDDGRATKEQLGAWFPIGAESGDWLATFEILHRSLIDRHRRLPLPCSFLVDEGRRLAYIYKGPVDVSTLIQDAGRLKLQGVEFALANAPFPGRWHKGPSHPRLFQTAGMFHDYGFTDPAMFYLEETRKLVGAPGADTMAQRQLSDSQLRAGVALLDQKRYDEAERVFRQSISYNESDALPWYALGQTYYSRDRMADAQQCYERAVALDPSFAAAWNVLGAVRFAQNDAAGALQAYEQAVQSDPNMSEAWFALGAYYISAQQVTAGIDCFRKVVALQPDMSLGWTGLGTCLFMNGDAPGAEQAIRKALELDPANERAKALLAELAAAPR